MDDDDEDTNLAGKRGDDGEQEETLNPKVEDVLEKVTEKIFDEIDELRESIDMMRHPRGTKESPARSCKDIKLGFPDSDDGGYCILYIICQWDFD